MDMSNAVISFPALGIELDPGRYFTLFGRNFYWYGVIIAVGFILAVWYCVKRAPQFGLKADNIVDMLIFAVPSGIICARLYYCLTFIDKTTGLNPYLQDPVSMLYIWKGGLAIYGGIIGAVIAVAIYCKVKKIAVGAMLDVGGLGLLIGQTVGRWGNFINREAFGVNPDGSEVTIFCRMGLTVDGVTTYVHPTFLYESVWNVIGFIIIHTLTKKKKRRYDGQAFIWYVAWYALGRMFIEGLREDYLPLGASGLRISQLLSIILLAAALFLLFYNKVLKYRNPENMLVNRVAAAAEQEETTTAEAPYEEARNVEEKTEVMDEAPAEEPPESGETGADGKGDDQNGEL